MKRTKQALESIEVLTPIWVLKTKVEQDWEQFRLSSITPTINAAFDEDEDPEYDSELPSPFPETDSTIKCLEILEKYDIFFNTKGGYWENK